MAVVEWIVQYRVDDPYEFLFKVRNLDSTFRAMNEAVMRETVGDRTVTEVVTVGRQEIETSVEVRLQALTEQYQMGITIDQVVLQDVNPPDPVKPSWDEVSQAQQQRDRLINEALAEYNAVIPRARGEAQQTILQAEAYALDRVNRSQGEGTRFAAVEAAYRQAPGCDPAADVSGNDAADIAAGRPEGLRRRGRDRRLAAAVARQRRASGDRLVDRHHTTHRRWPVNRNQPILLVLLLVGLFLLGSSVYTVNEFNQAVITQFGEPVGEPVTEPGLHLKVPFVQDREHVREAVPGVGRHPEPGADTGPAIHLGRHLRPVAYHRPIALLPAFAG